MRNTKVFHFSTITCLRLLLPFGFILFLAVASAEASRQKLANEANSAIAKATALGEEGRYAEALPHFQRYLEIVEKIDARNDENMATALNNVAYSLFQLGKYNEAIPVYERTLKIVRGQKSGMDKDDLYVLSGLGGAYAQSGRYQDATLIFDEVLGVCEKVFGEEHPETARALVNLAAVQKQLDDVQTAFQSCQRAVKILEKAREYSAPLHAYALVELASIFSERGEWDNAIAASQKALKLNTDGLKADDPRLAGSLTQVGSIYLRSGDYASAIPLFQRALDILERNDAPPLGMSSAHADLGRAFAEVGDYPKAIEHYKEAIKLVENETDENSRMELANSLNGLGLQYEAIGDSNAALKMFQASLSIEEKLTGTTECDLVPALLNISRTFKMRGDYSKATEFGMRAQNTALKEKNSHHLPYTLSNMAELILLKDKNRRSSQAEMLKAVDLFEKQRGGRVGAGVTLNDWVKLCIDADDYSGVRPFLEKALVIFEDELGPQHPHTSSALSNLSRVAYMEGDSTLSRSYASRAVAAKDRHLQSVLKLDESARLAWQQAHAKLGAEACTLSPDQIGGVNLRWKGAVLDSIFEDQMLAKSAAADDQGRRDLESIRELRIQAAQLASTDGNQEELENLEKQIAAAQQRLAERLSVGGRVRRNADLTVDVLLPQLDSSWALVDFLIFSDPKLPKGERDCYAAILVDANGPTKFIRLAARAEIDAEVLRLRGAITTSDEKTARSSASLIYSLLVQPLATQLSSDVRGLVVSPEGDLNFLPFAVLLDEHDNFLSEKYPITYVGSARDLVRKSSEDPAKSLALFADPTFDASGEASAANDMVAMRSAEAEVFGVINLPPLPGTKAEALEIETIAKQSGWDIHVATGDEATESSVRSTMKPGVLHLATHGFYLNSFNSGGEDGTRGMSVVGLSADEKKQNENVVDPMRASGVALTGAQQTLKSWSQRKAPDPETDGILTAEEVACLDLNGTWLVTLSACETGVGEARSGEGVFGLRRAFMMAGAENLLMTLWPVADDTTAKIMADFYKEALATGDAPGSLAKVQRDWLVKLREEKDLATAIREAGPFAMVMMTAPTHPPVELPAPSSSKSGWWPF